MLAGEKGKTCLKYIGTVNANWFENEVEFGQAQGSVDPYLF